MDLQARATELLDGKDNATAAELSAILSQLQEEGNSQTTARREIITKLERLLQSKISSFLADPTDPVLSTTSAKQSGLRPVPDRLSERKIGDINLAMTPVELCEEPYERVFAGLISDLIVLTNGLVPASIKPEFIFVTNGDEREQKVLLRADWEFPRALSETELRGLYQLVDRVYDEPVAGIKKNGKSWEHVEVFRRYDEKVETKFRGIYLGPDDWYRNTSPGLFVGRYFPDAGTALYQAKTHPYDWMSTRFGQTKRQKTAHVVLRDAGWSRDVGGDLKRHKSLSQEKYIWLCVQVASVLKRGRFLDSRALYAEIFRRLNRVGTSAIDNDKLFGLEPMVAELERVMLAPVIRPKAAAKLRPKTESAMLAGVPGGGKTTLEHYLMNRYEDVLPVAVDGLKLKAELEKSNKRGSDSSEILLRTSEIRQHTGLKMIMIIDDIDTVATGDLVSKFLNLMQGIREASFDLLCSTNYPWDIDERLLEPGRISQLIHVGLGDADNRWGVLSAHLSYRSVSRRDAEQMLEWAVPRTEGWTNRYLWELTNVAAQLAVMEDARKLLLRHIELAYATLETKIDIEGLRSWDERIAKFVKKHQQRYGFQLGS